MRYTNKRMNFFVHPLLREIYRLCEFSYVNLIRLHNSPLSERVILYST